MIIVLTTDLVRATLGWNTKAPLAVIAFEAEGTSSEKGPFTKSIHPKP